MSYLLRTILGIIALAFAFCGAAGAAEQVDLLLVLASDVSRSVDTRKFELQRQGYAAALSNPRVIDAIKSGPHGRIAICFLEWSGATSQKLVIDWTDEEWAIADKIFRLKLAHESADVRLDTTVEDAAQLGFSFMREEFKIAPRQPPKPGR